MQSPGDENTPLNLEKNQQHRYQTGLNAIDIPASVKTLSIDTIRTRGDNNIHEAVSRITGIADISNLGAGVSYSASGFKGNDSVGQAEDGVRLLTAAGTLSYPSDRYLGVYQGIEILRGPSSVLFGDGTVGGIVNSIRKAPSHESSVEALVGGGSRGEYRVGIVGTGAVDEIGAFRADASVTGGNGYLGRGEHQSEKLMTNLLLIPTTIYTSTLLLTIQTSRQVAIRVFHCGMVVLIHLYAKKTIILVIMNRTS